MESDKRFLAFDLGAESGRAVVGEINNMKLDLTELHRFPTGSTRINGHEHWNILGFYIHVLEGLRIYAAKYGSRMDGMGVDTWGVDFGLLDGQGNLLGFPYTYRDARTKGMDAVIEEKLGNRELYELSGIQLLPFNTVNQLVSLVESGAPALMSAEGILFIGDLLHFFLTGVKKTEFTVASISQLYNPRTGQWENKIFKALGIPATIHTEIIRAGDQVGKLQKDVAIEVGLEEVPVIAPAVHDTASAAVAVPTMQTDGWAFLSSGTWSIVGLELDQPIINSQSHDMNISNSGGALNKSLYLKNVMGLWIIQCCKRVWNRDNPSLGYPEIERMASEAEPFLGFIDPDDERFLNPKNAARTVVEYLRMTDQSPVDENNVGQVARIVFESLAMKYRCVLERLTEATGRKIDILHITGGGSKNVLLNIFTASALNRRVTAGPVEATAIGNILIQAYGAGVCQSLKELRSIVLNSFEVLEYLPDSPDLWEKEYIKFKRMMEGRSGNGK